LTKNTSVNYSKREDVPPPERRNMEKEIPQKYLEKEIPQKYLEKEIPQKYLERSDLYRSKSNFDQDDIKKTEIHQLLNFDRDQSKNDLSHFRSINFDERPTDK
jgi:hypothetical protein